MEESKQVKFNVETVEKEEKIQKAPAKPAAINQPTLRTQTFSQNHPGLSSELGNDMAKQHVNVLPPLPTQNNLPFPPINHNTFTQQQRNLFPPPPPPPYQFSQFSSWKPEERQIQSNQPPPSSSWWSAQQNQNYPTQDNFQHYPYLNPNQNFSNLDYSPWRQQQRPFVSTGFENQGQNLSMRQAMLKEAINMPNFASGNTGRTNVVSNLFIFMHRMLKK